jgi:hypothetical protein
VGDVGGSSEGSSNSEIGDATVVAILDYQPFSAYHWDLLGSKMPQHQDHTPHDDLPLDEPPDRWLPGFPTAKERTWAIHELPIDLERAETPGAKRVDLWRADRHVWADVRRSATASAANYYWIPNSKVIGALTFGSDGLDGDRKLTDEVTANTTHWDAHGVGTTSNAVGNLHGACPECLVVFIEVDVSSIELLPEGHDPRAAEQALQWAMSQPWIDVIETSWSLSATPFTRDRIYNGGDETLHASKVAAERGQTWFVSAGNGHDSQGAVATTSYTSSAQGPDWNITVSGIDVANDRNTMKTGAPQYVDVVSPTTTVDGRGVFLGDVARGCDRLRDLREGAVRVAPAAPGPESRTGQRRHREGRAVPMRRRRSRMRPRRRKAHSHRAPEPLPGRRDAAGDRVPLGFRTGEMGVGRATLGDGRPRNVPGSVHPHETRRRRATSREGERSRLRRRQRSDRGFPGARRVPRHLDVGARRARAEADGSVEGGRGRRCAGEPARQGRVVRGRLVLPPAAVG